MRKSEVIAQFPIAEEFLLNRNNQLRNFMETDRIHRYLAKNTRPAFANSIKDLRTGMSRISLKAKVLEVEEPKHVITRYGTRASVARALITDKTGKIRLCLWNRQIATVSAGDTVQIENARISTYRGERYVNLGRAGTVDNVGILNTPK